MLLPDAGFLLDFSDIIRMVTLAPEMPGGIAFLDTLRQRTDIVLALGHSDATYEQAVQAYRHGLSHVTHAFNAMSPLRQRAPGAVGAALSLPLTVELIADGIHVHPGLFPLMVRAKGDKLVLVTDCTRAGGMPEGEYTLGRAGHLRQGRLLPPGKRHHRRQRAQT